MRAWLPAICRLFFLLTFFCYVYILQLLALTGSWSMETGSQAPKLRVPHAVNIPASILYSSGNKHLSKLGRNMIGVNQTNVDNSPSEKEEAESVVLALESSGWHLTIFIMTARQPVR